MKDLLAYLRVVANPSDEVSARRIVNVPAPGRGRHLGRPPGRVGARQRVARSPTPSTTRPRPGVTGQGGQGRGRAARRCSTTCGRMVDGGAGPGALVEAVADAHRVPCRARGARTPSRPHGRLENIAELAGAAGEYDTLDEFLESVALVSDADELDGRRQPGVAHDAAHGQGPRVPGRLPGGHGGRRLPPPPRPRRPAAARGGAPARLRGHHPGPAPALRHPRLEPDPVGLDQPRHPQPVPVRAPGRAGARRRGRRGRCVPTPLRASSWSRRRLGLGAPARAEDWRRRRRRRPRRRRRTAATTPDAWAQDFHDPDPWDDDGRRPVRRPAPAAPPVRRAPAPGVGRAPAPGGRRRGARAGCPRWPKSASAPGAAEPCRRPCEPGERRRTGAGPRRLGRRAPTTASPIP